MGRRGAGQVAHIAPYWLTRGGLRELRAPAMAGGRSPRSGPADRRGGAHAEAKMALLAARAAAAAAEALGGALAASLRNLGFRECKTSTGASALEELQRAATASAAAAAATFRHWQDGQAAPKPSETTTGNGSSKTARRRRQRRRHQQREAAAGRAPETPPAHHGTDADAGGGSDLPPTSTGRRAAGECPPAGRDGASDATARLARPRGRARAGPDGPRQALEARRAFFPPLWPPGGQEGEGCGGNPRCSLARRRSNLSTKNLALKPT